jgi:hypothetical protein
MKNELVEPIGCKSMNSVMEKKCFNLLTSNFRFWILDFGLKEIVGSCPTPRGWNKSKISNRKSPSPVPLWAGSIQNRKSLHPKSVDPSACSEPYTQ